MSLRNPIVEKLTTDERLALIAELWDSLEPAAAGPLTASLAAELARREAELDSDPSAGRAWSEIRSELQKKLG